jgi:hypothetical protein
MVLEKIWPWMKKNGMVPSINPLTARREGIDADIDEYKELGLFFNFKTNVFNALQVIGYSSDLDIEGWKKDSLGKKYWRQRREEIIYFEFIEDSFPQEKLDYGTDSIIDAEVEYTPIDEIDIRKSLNIHGLLGRFFFSLDDEDASFYKLWELGFHQIAAAHSKKAKERLEKKLNIIEREKKAKQLEEKTGISVLRWYRALKRCNDDIKKATEMLRKESSDLKSTQNDS